MTSVMKRDTDRTTGTTPPGEQTRVHIGLAAGDISASVAFYRALLGEEPTKRKEDYAKFEPAHPPLTLSLIHDPNARAAASMPSHFGLRVADDASLSMAEERLRTIVGGAIRREQSVECCYAQQNKIWVTDPDGNAWEVYRLISDDGTTLAKQFAENDAAGGACCDSSCCTS